MAANTHKPEATYRLKINGREMRGQKVGGKWLFTCAAYPDLAEKYDGAEDASDCVEEFTRRALADADGERPDG